MPKKRKRIRVEPWLWSIFVLIVAVSLFKSPATGLSRVTVVGAQEPYKSYIRSTIKKYSGTPAMEISAISVESKIHATSAVESATFHRNIFGRGKLTIHYRKPIAKFQASPELYLDSTGTVFRSLVPYEGLPEIDLYEGGLSATLTQTGLWPSRRIAWLVSESKKYVPGLPFVIEVQATGAVSLIINSDTTIRLGTSYDFEKKLKELGRLQQQTPDLLKRAKSINLVAPENPVWTPRQR